MAGRGALAPNRDVPDLVALDGDERDELAEVYLDLLGRLDRYYQGPSGSPIALPYIAGWHQAPVRQGRDVSRLHLQVVSVRPLDRLSDKQIRARAKHIVTEIERVRATVALLRSRRLPDVGPVFNASHASMRDDFEISCAELGLAVEVTSAHDALGARMTGGGLGGSAITLVPTDSTAEVTSAVIQAFADKGFAPHCFPVTAASLPPTRTSGGQAGRFANRLAGGRFSLDDDADAIPDQRDVLQRQSAPQELACPGPDAAPNRRVQHPRRRTCSVAAHVCATLTPHASQQHGSTAARQHGSKVQQRGHSSAMRRARFPSRGCNAPSSIVRFCSLMLN